MTPEPNRKQTNSLVLSVARDSLLDIDYSPDEGKWIYVNVSRIELCRHLENWTEAMAEGTIKRIMDKGFGFIDEGTGKDIFFHSSAVVDGQFDQLYEGQQVSYTVGSGPKGPCAENVKSV